ncbi:SDR family NAD(P)-dependent oxidoreductase [Mycolicibacterium confluentis]|uniref:Oxidoreductase n=1 Tax=Mycolicibacterium confluentis TaxID=28047 RepID=A0A7I7Y5W5_9MYCO|nr:SDR family oxidoreductase [Mycolicibacterium confluentis]MCV7319305.1 SDR family oxidoreductase [Mycolicibacterium confluentis]ORV25755.1 short-chain dehydrogenase [Mycolicibacterium confluentis]BBZ36483.1 oxidoreductase [Mycolicibacterium confluentis]
MGQLDGRTALVTGGNSGIGLATAKRLADEGAYVFITGRDRKRLDEAAAKIGAHGVQSDISKPEELDALAAEIAERGKGLDVLFANAGGGDFATLAEVTPQHYRDNFDRNVAGTVFTVQKALPLLNAGASVVLAGSTAPSKGIPAFGLYAASKAAIRSLGRTWAAELADRKIRVNTIIPGPIETPGLTGLAPEGEQQALLDSWAEQVPMKRVGHPDEIAAAVLFLASDQSSFMTGAELVVDGGQIQI